MADLQSTDEFLVNHDGTTYTQEQGTLMANLESDDLLLINRSDVTYTITGDELISSIIDPLEVNVTLAPLPPTVNSSVTATAFAVGGKAPDGGYVFTYEWTLADNAAGTGAAVQAETSNIYTLPGDSEGKFIKCEATTTDALGTTESGDSGYVEIEVTTAAPDIASVLLTEVGSADGRFTNNEFPFVTTMAVDGEPAPTYEAKARVFGATYNVAVKSDVITDVEDVDAAWKNLNLNNEGWYDIAASDTTFVIVAYNEGPNRIKYSNDKGLTWEDATGFDATKVYRAVNYIPEVSRFFASWEGTPGGLYWSDDGASWTACTGLTIGSLGEVLYDSNTNAVIFATGGSTFGVYTSSDSGESFTAVSSNFADYATSLFCVAYNPANSTLLIGTVGGMLRSTDSGATWAKETTFNYSDVIWDSVNNIFAAVCMNPGKGIVRFDAQGQFIGAIDVGNNRDGGICIDNSDYKLVCSRGSNAAWHYSTDAQNWTEVQDYPTGGEYRRIAAIDNIFIAVSYSGTQRVVRSEGGVGGSLTTLTFATASNLDKFNAGADVKMTDAAGNDATYQPVTSQITGVEDVTVTVDEDSVTIEGNPYGPFDGNDSTFLAVSTSQTRTANVTLSTPVTGNLYVLGGNGTSDTNTSNLLTITNGGSSATQSFTSMTPTEYPLGAVTNWSTFRLYAGTGDRGGCYIYKFMIDRNDGKGKVDLIIKPGSLLTLTNEQDLKYFRQGDVVQAPDVKVVSTDPDAVPPTMTVDGGEWDVSNQSQIWSSYAVSGDATGVFNGTLDYYSTNGVGFQVYDLQLQSAGLTASSSIEVMFESQTDFGNSVTINGINVIPFAVRQPANTWCDVTAEVGLGRIDTIIAATGGSSITAIVGFRIDGKLLIDAVNDSQVWSNYLTTGTGSWESSTPSGQDWSGAYKPSLAFNGKLTQSTMGYGDPCFSLSEGHYIYFEPQEPFTDVVSVEYYGDKSYARNIGINQESTAATTNPAAPTQDGSLSPFGEWVSVVNPPSTINRMWFKAWSGANGSTAVRGIKINGKLLVDAGVRDLGDTEVTGPTNGATGKFGGATGNTATVTDVTGRWVANDNGKGEQFFMEPTVPQADQVAELFCDLAIEGDKAVVKSLSESDPGFLPITDKDYSVKFNSQLASGEAPDDALPNGTQIEVTVKATNDVGSDEETSNAVTPTVPNPDGSAGPITGVEETTVELWNQDQDWSETGYEIVFDGDLSNQINIQPNQLITFSTKPITVNSKVELYSGDAVVASILKFDGIDCPVTTPPEGPFQWREVDISGLTLGSTYNLLQVIWPYPPNTSSNGYTGIRIDGRILVDQGIAGPAPTEEQTKLTVDSSTNLDTFTADDTVKMVDANGAIASYKPTTSPITNVSGTTLTFTNSQDIKYFNVGDVLKSNKNLTGLKFILSEKPSGGSLDRPDRSNFYVGGVFSNGMLLTDNAHFYRS